MAKQTASPHPEWATAHRKPGTELRFINGKYYLYSVSSKYDSETKRTKKVTGKILGSVTKEAGFTGSDKRRIQAEKVFSVDRSTVFVRELGFSSFVGQYGKEITAKLKQFYPQDAELIVYMAYCRIVHQSPIKDMPFHTAKSMLSEGGTGNPTDKAFSAALRSIGKQRGAATNYLKSFFRPGDHVLVDLTNVFSNSEKMHYAKKGYNSEMVFEKQFNLMYIYSAKLQQPVFYRLFPGNLTDVKGFRLCLKESGLSDAVVIADKGFHSKANVEAVGAAGLKYIIPLKRDNGLVDYQKINDPDALYFKFDDRYVRYTCYEAEGQKIYGFRDDKLRVQEEKDYLDRIVSIPEKYTTKGFGERRKAFGTIAMVSNTGYGAEQVYCTYKSRGAIETMFDGMKTILAADKTYMQNEDALQGWMFVNHVALQWHYIIYNILKDKDQLKKYSVNDFIKHLYEIKQVRINGEWIPEPQIKATEKMLKKLNISLT